ncbi:MAG: hypothetical protein R3B09_10610 [Nannocystaceae bacterium]
MKTERRTMNLETMYFNDTGLFAGHRIRIELERSGEPEHDMVGSMILDPNACGLDLWGDRTVCTRMATLTHPARAVLMRTRDEKGHHRRHWALDVEGIPAVNFHLIEYGRVGYWYLVADGGERGTAVLPLLPADWFAPVG